MSKIRLRISSTDTQSEEESCINYNQYLKKFINNTLFELKHQLNLYNSSREIECRKNMAVFFRQKIADFELLYLLDLSVEYLHKIRNIVSVNPYEEIADRLAFVYANLKNTIAPPWNVKGALNNLYLDEICQNNRNAVDDKKYIERFIKISLLKEDLEFFESVVVNDNLILLDNCYKVALCGELSNPKYKLLTKSSFVGDFSFKKFVKYQKIEKKYFELHKIYEKFRNLTHRTDLKVEGNYTNFSVSLDNKKVEISDIALFSSKFYKHIETICKNHQGLKFSIDNGWFTYCKSLEIVDFLETDLIFNIEGEEDIVIFIKEYADKSICVYIWSIQLFEKFVKLTQNSRLIYIPVEKIFGKEVVDKELNHIILGDVRICNIIVQYDIVSFTVYAKKIQLYINDGIIVIGKRECRMLFESFFNFLTNSALCHISIIKDFPGTIILYSDYILFKIESIAIEVYSDKFKVEEVFCNNLRLYLGFLQNIYFKGSKILKKNFSVEIEGVIFEYDNFKDKIISNTKNTEIHYLKNIGFVLKHLRMLYNLELIPDIVTQKYAVFNMKSCILKIYFSQQVTFYNNITYFNSLKKIIVKEGKDEPLIVNFHNFMQMYTNKKPIKKDEN